MPTLYATHGMTGSGKSTFAKKFCTDKKIIRLAHDEIMITLYGSNPPKELFKEYAQGVDRLLEKLTRDLLNSGDDVFLDLGLFKRRSRDSWKEISQECGAKFVIYFLDCSREVALERTLKRTGEMPNGAFFIDENAFNIINARIEPLQDDEDFIRITEQSTQGEEND